MRKVLLFALMMTLCLPLCGCAGEVVEEQAENVQLYYQDLSAAAVEAELTCQYADEVRTYTLRCNYTPAESTVEVLAPEGLAGISATFAGGDLTIQYDGIILDAGNYSGTDISPLWAVPSMLQAMGQGYPLEYCQEERGGMDCLRVTFEKTEDAGERRCFSVWFDGEGVPLQGEITVGEAVVYTVAFTQFTAEETNDGTTTAEDLGGD